MKKVVVSLLLVATFSLLHSVSVKASCRPVRDPVVLQCIDGSCGMGFKIIHHGNADWCQKYPAKTVELSEKELAKYNKAIAGEVQHGIYHVRLQAFCIMNNELSGECMEIEELDQVSSDSSDESYQQQKNEWQAKIQEYQIRLFKERIITLSILGSTLIIPAVIMLSLFKPFRSPKWYRKGSLLISFVLVIFQLIVFSLASWILTIELIFEPEVLGLLNTTAGILCISEILFLLGIFTKRQIKRRKTNS